MSRRDRVLVTPREIAGVASGLQFVLGRRGFSADVLLRWPHPFAYSLQPTGSRLLRVLAGVIAEHEAAVGARVRRAASLALRTALLPYLAARYGAVVYIGPDTLLRGGLDRRLLGRLGVRTITVFLGSEARPPYLDGWYAAPGSPASLDDARAAVRRNRERVELAERDSSFVVNHAGGVQFHRKPFLDWTVVGYPQRSDAAPESATRTGPDGQLRVLHAPSDPRMKGTEAIRAAIATLRAEGIDIEYVEVTGRAHADVLQLLGTADLVVDQLYSDALLPGLASEAAHAGTAVLVCGYAADLLEDAARRAGAPTSHYAHPDQLLPRLRELLTDGERRAELAAGLHRFITHGWWSADATGARWERILGGTPDPAWFSSPQDIVYVHGCAVAAADGCSYLRAYVDRFGADALELEHHPRLAAAVADRTGG